jgi:hypothetical protein
MLQDPENYEEWEDYVWAASQGEAWSKCQVMADEAPLTEVINVTQSTKKRSKTGTFKFICWFRSEVQPHDNGNT